MKTPEEILDTELEKLKPNGFIRLFYKANRTKVLDIIRSIQNESYNQGIKELELEFNNDLIADKQVEYYINKLEESVSKLLKP